jgi:hypothetical protein
MKSDDLAYDKFNEALHSACGSTTVLTSDHLENLRIMYLIIKSTKALISAAKLLEDLAKFEVKGSPSLEKKAPKKVSPLKKPKKVESEEDDYEDDHEKEFEKEEEDYAEDGFDESAVLKSSPEP